MSNKDWFKDWFNSKYYHLLYGCHDQQEAHGFIDALLQQLSPAENALFLDVACGKGRHAIYLNQQGFEVTGIDLSPKSIAMANEAANSRLHFEVHDMRSPFREAAFDYVLNLFTSFGYFQKEEDHQKALDAMAANLKQGGTLVLDFMNAAKVLKTLIVSEEKELGGICFHIRRTASEGKIIKEISFQDQEEEQQFTEEVRAFRLPDFQQLFEQAGLKITEVFGDYHFGAFDEESSDRLIIFAKKE